MENKNPLRLSMQYFAEETPAPADASKEENEAEETVNVPKGKFEQFWSKLLGNDEGDKADGSKAEASKADQKAKPTTAQTNVNIEELLKQERLKWEAEQAKKFEIDKLPADEKAKAEAEEVKAKLAEAQRQIETNNLKNRAITYLQSENYPIELLDCLNYASQEAYEKSLAAATTALESCRL